jgi:hypothetical protein
MALGIELVEGLQQLGELPGSLVGEHVWEQGSDKERMLDGPEFIVEVRIAEVLVVVVRHQ